MSRNPALAATDLMLLAEALGSIGNKIAVEKCVLLDRVVVGDLSRKTPLKPGLPGRTDRAGSRDNRVMKFGQVIELKNALSMCDIAYAGANFAGIVILNWNLQAADEILSRDVNACVDPINLLVEIMRDPVKLEYLTKLGTYVRYRGLYEKYWSEVEAFADGRQGSDPNAQWRRDEPTPSQIYMIQKVADLLAIGDPSFAHSRFETRGEAYDFIAQSGGNPRFRVRPLPPSDPKATRPENETVHPRLESNR